MPRLGQMQDTNVLPQSSSLAAAFEDYLGMSGSNDVPGLRLSHDAQRRWIQCVSPW